MPGGLKLRLSQTLRSDFLRFVRSDFLRQLSRYSLSTTSGQVMMMIYILVVARVLGPEQFGVYSGTYALTGLTIFIVSWGMDTWLLREPGSLENPTAWAGRVLQIKAWLGLGWGLLLVAGAPLVRGDIFSPALVAICALDMWCDGAFNTHITALNIQKRIRAVSYLIFFARLARLAGALGLAAAGLGSPLTFALARAFATLGGLVAAAVVLKPDWHGKAAPGNRQVLASTADYALSELMVVVYMQADVTLLNLMTTSQTTGYYSSASSLINALFIIPATVFNLIIPNLARKLINAPAHFGRAAGKALLGFAGLGLGLALGIGLLGGWLLRFLLGSQYNISSVILTVLSPLLLFKSLTLGFAAIIIAVGWQRQRLLPQAVSAVFNVLVNIWIIPQLGVPGVALVYCASELILAIGYGMTVWRWFRSANPAAASSEPV